MWSRARSRPRRWGVCLSAGSSSHPLGRVVVRVLGWGHGVPARGDGGLDRGTGRAQAFNDVALAVVNTLRQARQGAAPLSLAAAGEQRLIEYIPFPEALRGKYQAYTQADVTQLRAAGFEAPMQTVEQGTASYMRWLLANA